MNKIKIHQWDGACRISAPPRLHPTGSKGREGGGREGGRERERERERERREGAREREASPTTPS
jgi:hypothetical protein